MSLFLWILAGYLLFGLLRNVFNQPNNIIEFFINLISIDLLGDLLIDLLDWLGEIEGDE